MFRQRGVSVWLWAASALMVALFIMAGSAVAQAEDLVPIPEMEDSLIGIDYAPVGDEPIVENEGEECPWVDCSVGVGTGAGAAQWQDVKKLTADEEAARDQQAAEDPADEPASQSDPAGSADGNAPRISSSLPERLPNTGFPALALLGSGLSAAALAFWRRRS